MDFLTKIFTNIFLIIILIGIFLIFTFYNSYSNFKEEEPIAILKFEKISNKEYLAYIYLKDKTYNLITYGDQWRLDAQFKKWKYFATAIGFKSKYVLDRFEGRYKNIDEQNNSKKLSHDLYEKTILDFLDMNKDKNYNLLIDTTYGNSVYQDIKENTFYKVYKNSSTLLVRESSTEKEEKKPEKNILDNIRYNFFK